MADPNPNIATLISNIIAADAVYSTRKAPVLEQIENYVWAQYTNTAGNDVPGQIEKVADVDGLGAAIYTELTRVGITYDKGGAAYWLEKITNGVMTYPDTRAANNVLDTRSS